MGTLSVARAKNAWRMRRTLASVMLPRKRPPTRLIDLRIRWEIARLMGRSNRTRMYHPIPFPEFADVIPPRHRACEQRWQALRSVLPDDLSNLRIIDLGAAEGYFSFRCVHEGASVLALEQDYHKTELMRLLKKRYKLDTFEAVQADLSTASLRTHGEFDYAFYLNIHQHIYKTSPEAANRILSELGAICRRGIFVEARPVEFSSAVAALNPTNAQPFRRIEDLVDTIRRGSDFAKATELFYKGYDWETDHRQSVPEGSDSEYRLFYLARDDRDQIPGSAAKVR